MKKKIIIPIIFIVIIIILVAIGIFLINRNKDDKTKDTLIRVDNWNGRDKEYVVGKADCEVSFDDFEMKTYIWSDKDIFDNFGKENNDFVSDYTYRYLDYEYEAKLFYNDNNYYIIYINGDKDDYNYIAHNMVSIIRMSNNMYVPTMMDIGFSDDLLKSDEFKNGFFDTFFNNFSFDQNKEFYERMDDDYYSIDEESHTISIRGWDLTEKEYVDDALTIDFDNRTMTVKEYDGTTEVYK